MATIPTRRESVTPTGQAGLDRRPGQEIRQEAQRQLGSAQSIISLTGSVVNAAGQLGQQFVNSKRRTEQAEYNAGLEGLSTDLQAKYADNPDAEKFQIDFQAGDAALREGKKFLGDEAKFAGEARMARDVGTIIQRQVTLQKDKDLAGLNSQQRVMTAQGQTADPLVSAMKILEFGTLVDAAVEDRVITEQDGDKRKHSMQFNTERGRAILLPTEPAIQGLQEGTLLASGTPEQRLALTEQIEAKFYRTLERRNATESSADTASEAALKKKQDAAMIQVQLGKLNDTLTPVDVEALATLLDPGDFSIAVNTVLQVNAPEDDGSWMQMINTAIDNDNTAQAKFIIAEALVGGFLTPSAADSFRRVVRTRSEDLSPVQKRGLSLIRESLAPPPGARSEAIIYQQARLNASVEYLKQLELNPVLPSGDIDKMAQDIVQRFSVFVTSDIVETFGLPVEVLEVNPDLNQDTVTVDDFVSAGEITQGKLEGGLIDRDEWRLKMDRLNLWTDEMERRNAAEKKKAEKGTRRGR